MSTSRPLVQSILGIIVLLLGLWMATFGVRPWIDYDFLVIWVGFLLITDSLAFLLSGASLFTDMRAFFQLAIMSSFFWWLWEGFNIQLTNWAYLNEPLYTHMEWGFFSTLAFATVIPHLMISTNIVQGLLPKQWRGFRTGSFSPNVAYTIVACGILLAGLVLLFPIQLFPFVWLTIFLILDPLNAKAGRASLLVQWKMRNYRPFILLAVASLLAGLGWETLNYFVPKWVYPVVPWFWTLPAPITTLYAEMPLAGFIGYIPFIFSAFAFVVFFDIPTKWLSRHDG